MSPSKEKLENGTLDALDLNSVARRLGVSRRTVDGLANRGELVTFRLVRRRLVRVADFEAFIEGRVRDEAKRVAERATG